MTIGRPGQLVELARSIAAANPDFQAVRGPGDGDRATQRFMTELRELAHAMFGQDFSEKKICGENAFAVDFYFAEEETIVEVALGLPNPASEFEKDILKAIIAQDQGQRVRRLVFISRAGAMRKCAQPGRYAVQEWARARHGLSVEIQELAGEPRRRHRGRGAAVETERQTRGAAP